MQSWDLLAARPRACVPVPEDRPSSCRSASPRGRQDLFTFCHLAWNVACHPFTDTRLWLSWSHFWKQKEVEDVFIFGPREGRGSGVSSPARLLAFHGNRGAAWPGSQFWGWGPEKEAGHTCVAPPTILRHELLHAETSAISKCTEDPLTGPQLRNSPPPCLLCTCHRTRTSGDAVVAAVGNSLWRVILRQNHRNRKRISGCQGVRGGEITVFPDGPAGKESGCREGDAGDTGSIPGLGRSPGDGRGNPLQYCLENPTDRGAWPATVQRVTKSRTRLSDYSVYTHTHSKQMWGFFAGGRSILGLDSSDGCATL